ncbi:DUF1344 domain-containing protein [Acuticoccus sp. M5D2P5]|uniref:DUF1344 domain-containing protein n=1 Tax=Acuticoccus kalidii TaxID=2910977 RepID=UPI001F309266|nr:DUF1344 domain-containing protein [Acuticoccus kalidii]MCF3933740.1 DUF1344 domain-containing protein [Acuticoccus kalidii]
MRKIVLSALIATAMAAAPALAAESAMGTIKSMDTTARTITLDNGMTYHLPSGQMTTLKAGEKVKVDYVMEGKVRQAEHVTVAK